MKNGFAALIDQFRARHEAPNSSVKGDSPFSVLSCPELEIYIIWTPHVSMSYFTPALLLVASVNSLGYSGNKSKQGPMNYSRNSGETFGYFRPGYNKFSSESSVNTLRTN